MTKFTPTTYLLKNILLCLIILTSAFINAQIQEPFAARYNESIKGDVTIIANNMLSRTATTSYNGPDGNHDFFDNVYVDIDSDATTFNSSSANFSNPNTNLQCLNLNRVLLYWAAADRETSGGTRQGRNRGNGDNQPNWNYNDVKLMLPGEVTYTTITADDVIYRGRDFHISNDPYICYKDITASVLALSDFYGKYQIANVEAAVGGLVSHDGFNTGTAGGWQIIFVYESPELPSKNISLFDGYAHVTSTINNFDITFTGFQTIPTGNISANIVIGALEGDKDLNGDKLQILDTSNNFVDISTTQRNSDNFFNSKITIGNTEFINRNPASTNTLGFDAAVFTLNNPGNSIITNNQTSATIRLTSDQETYGLYLVGFAVEVWEPSLSPMPLSIASGTNPANPGDIIGYNLGVFNSGNDEAVNIELTTTIPPQVTFLGLNNLPSGVTYTFDNTTGQLIINIDDGIITVGGGFDLEFDLEINDECYFLEDTCDLSFGMQFTATYNGIQNSDNQTTLSSAIYNICSPNPLIVDIIQPVVAWATAPGALDSTIECDDATALTTAQSLEPIPDKCVFNIIKTSGPFIPSPSCPEGGTYINSWTFTDACGVTIEAYVQTITIVDTTLPTASNPAAISVECQSDIPLPDGSIVTDEADNCSIPVIAFVSDSSDNRTCPETIIRTYSVTDACGNSISVIQTIVVNDTIAPTASPLPTINVQCIGDVPIPNTATVFDAADNCSAPTVQFISDTSDQGSCPEIITRIYRITDACNNILELSQQIIILDDIAPTASTPATINIQCIEDFPTPDIAVITDAADNCSTPTVDFISDVSDGGQCPQIISRTFRLTDDCGNTTDIIQTISVNDTIAPTASALGSVSLNCNTDSIPDPDISIITDAADNCSIPVVAYVSDVSNGLCPETIIRTYSVTDDCGNVLLLTQSFLSTDNVPPTISVTLVDITVDCDAIPALPDVSFTDNCNSDLTVVFTQTDTNNGNSTDYVIISTWTVTDGCGNVSVFTQTTSVLIANCFVSQCNSCGVADDIISPTASNPPDLNIDCTQPIPAPDPNVITDEADNCVPPVVAFVGEIMSVNCTERIIRTYSITDECGNVIYVTHTINIIDTISPTATNPAAINVTCSSAIPPPDILVVIDEADNCSTPSVAFVSDVTNNSCNQHVVRTYSITDECGNSILVTQDINVVDTIPPTASNPPTINLTCISNIPFPNASDVTDEADNCSTPSVSFISDISDNLTCPETITRTYRVTDECGNFIDVSQLIIINDNVAPTASNPNSIQVECIGDIPSENIFVVTDEADNCSIPNVAFVSDVSDNLSCPETIIRTYRVTDACGNFIEVTQTIIVNDTISPTASNPITIQVGQNSDIPNQDISVVTDEADNCSVPTVTFISEVSDNLICPETITRTYRITDACGNFIDVTQNIIILDTTTPTATGPQTLLLQCIGDLPVSDISLITNVSDNNSIPTVVFVSETSNNQTCPETIIRIYSVTDACGNFIELTHTIIINDDIFPTASNPVTLTFDDIALVPQPDLLVVIDESDNCSIPSVAFVSESSINEPCQQIITRIYSVTDACNNSINVTQEIIITDNNTPTGTAPGPLSFSCENAIPSPDPSTVTNVSDNYSTPTVTFISDTSNNQTCPEIITRIYRITDACGNYIEVTQEFSINDEIPPTASNPESTVLNDIDELEAPNIEVVIDEADNCSIPTVAFISETIDNNDVCIQYISRLYRATDACGNFIDVTHNITITDTINPTASNPQAITIDCQDEIPVPDISLITDATDNTSTPIITFVSESSNSDACSEIITRVYNISDACGNSINVIHLIYIEDTTAPTLLSNIENEITLVCGVAPNVDTLEFIDNCTANLTIQFEEEIIYLEGDNYDIIRTWTALDDCDNLEIVTQTIHMLQTIESFTNDFQLCINEEVINLMTFVDADANGIWESESLDVLEGTLFNPTTIPEGDYVFSYTVYTNECSRVNQIYINLNDNCIDYPCINSIFDIDISKLVTPNGDAKNETFDVSYILNEAINNPSECDIITTVKMFNRWGAKVYESDNYNNEWNGISPTDAFGSAIQLPAGTYYYIVDLVNSGLRPIQGFILLGTEK